MFHIQTLPTRTQQVSLVASAAEAAAAAPPGGSVSVVVSEGLQLLLPLAGLFDVDKELKRLEKQKTKVRAAAPAAPASCSACARGGRPALCCY
jgi:hypothetical protein